MGIPVMQDHAGSAGPQHDKRSDAAAENLRFAVTDHQETIRATDVKAEVVGILLTVLFGVAEWKGHLSTSGISQCVNTVAALSALIAVACVGRVLWPRSDPWRDVPLGEYTPTRVLYPLKAAPPGQHVKSRAELAAGTDWVCELTYELAKLAIIRDAKKFWFRAALVLSAVTLVAVAIGLFFPAGKG